MSRLVVFVIGALLVGGAIGFFVDEFPWTGESTSPSLANGTGEEVGEELTARLRRLETRLEEEVAQREALQVALEQLLEEGEYAGFSAEAALPPVRDGVADGEQDVAEDEESGWERRFANREERRMARLQESGFAPSQAAWILEREQQIRLDELYDRWQERRQAFLENASGVAERDPLREELGEQGYERYLEANGRPTAVRVSRLMDGSPASAAGFQPGDEIIRYNGERVFDLGDLNDSSVRGERGEPVLVDVVRDGNRIQLAIERGPLGIISRRRWR